MRKVLLLSGILSLGLLACGGGGGGGGTSSQGGISGKVVDEPIEGITVIDVTTGSTAITDTEGNFRLSGKLDDTLEFYIGNLKLGQVRAVSSNIVLTPIEIAPDKWQVATALIRKLDIDNIPSNGIQLPSDIKFPTISSIDDVDLNEPITVEMSNGETKSITLTENDVPTYVQQLAKLAEAYNLLKRYEGHNIEVSPLSENVAGYNINISTSQFTYLVKYFNYDTKNPLNSYADLTINIIAEISNEAQGTIKCSSQNGKLMYDTNTAEIIGNATLQCKGSVTVEGETYPVSGPLNAKIIIDPNNIDWQQASINGADVIVDGTLTVDAGEYGMFDLPINFNESGIILSPSNQ